MDWPEPPSSILFRDSNNTVFLIDIPTSISLAQGLSRAHHASHSDGSDRSTGINNRKSLLSSPPLTDPYPSNTEPKTELKRKRALQNISSAERAYHIGLIAPLVKTRLAELRKEYADGQDWCLERNVLDSSQDDKEYPETKRLCNGTKVSITSQSTAPVEDTPAEVRQAGSVLHCDSSLGEPPLVLSPTCVNEFASVSELTDQVTKDSSLEPATLRVGRGGHRTFYVPPLSTFLLCIIPTSNSERIPEPIPGLGSKKFNLILLDPPWPNKSVHRGRQYDTNPIDTLTLCIRDILGAHLYNHSTATNVENGVLNQEKNGLPRQQSIAAIWITNSEKSRKCAYTAIQSAGLRISEEWVWIKTTVKGQPVTPVEGIWRKPYEILVIAKRPSALDDGNKGEVLRRVIAAVPDIHSRKPNLREVFERLFFTSTLSLEDEATPGINDGVPYSALEVFARNLTAGWWACGDEVLKFNAEEWWVDR